MMMVLKGKYKKYLKISKKIKDKRMRLESIECSWKYCRKNNFKENKYKFRKCKGCYCRYCNRKCQKLDWNKGCHKEICLYKHKENFNYMI